MNTLGDVTWWCNPHMQNWVSIRRLIMTTSFVSRWASVLCSRKMLIEESGGVDMTNTWRWKWYIYLSNGHAHGIELPQVFKFTKYNYRQNALLGVDDGQCSQLSSRDVRVWWSLHKDQVEGPSCCGCSPKGELVARFRRPISGFEFKDGDGPLLPLQPVISLPGLQCDYWQW